MVTIRKKRSFFVTWDQNEEAALNQGTVIYVDKTITVHININVLAMYVHLSTCTMLKWLTSKLIIDKLISFTTPGFTPPPRLKRSLIFIMQYMYIIYVYHPIQVSLSVVNCPKNSWLWTVIQMDPKVKLCQAPSLVKISWKPHNFFSNTTNKQTHKQVIWANYISS